MEATKNRVALFCTDDACSKSGSIAVDDFFLPVFFFESKILCCFLIPSVCAFPTPVFNPYPGEGRTTVSPLLLFFLRVCRCVPVSPLIFSLTSEIILEGELGPHHLSPVRGESWGGGRG